MTHPYLTRRRRELVEAARDYANTKTVDRDGHVHTLTAHERMERKGRVVRLLKARRGYA